MVRRAAAQNEWYVRVWEVKLFYANAALRMSRSHWRNCNCLSDFVWCWVLAYAASTFSGACENDEAIVSKIVGLAIDTNTDESLHGKVLSFLVGPYRKHYTPSSPQPWGRRPASSLQRSCRRPYYAGVNDIHGLRPCHICRATARDVGARFKCGPRDQIARDGACRTCSWSSRSEPPPSCSDVADRSPLPGIRAELIWLLLVLDHFAFDKAGPGLAVAAAGYRIAACKSLS